MRQRILSIILALAGLLAIALAVASATVWKPSNTAVATLTDAPTPNYVVTEPGVLGVLDENVTITATAQNAEDEVLIAVGRSSDVAAWLGEDPYDAITGLSDWETLSSESHTELCPTTEADDAATDAATEEATAESTQSDAATAEAEDTEATDAAAEATEVAEDCVTLEATNADPNGSDLWISETTGTGTVTLEFDASDPNTVILVATDGASPAPNVSLSWPRTVSTPWLIPGLILGALLLGAGVFLFIIDMLGRRAAAERKARAAEKAAKRANADVTSTSVMAAIIGEPEDRPLTRRELREKERAEQLGEEWVDPRIPTELEVETRETGEEGVARGSAVVPGLSEEATAAYRQGRELEDESPMVFADDAPDESAEVASEEATEQTEPVAEETAEADATAVMDSVQEDVSEETSEQVEDAENALEEAVEEDTDEENSEDAR